MAYVLGYFAADGSMIENKRGGHYIEFTSTDKILLQKLRKIVGGTQKISERPQRNEKWKQQYRVQFGSREWFSDLIKLGFTQNKSKTICFPKVPQGYLHHFVRGYFDGDGSVHFKKYFAKDRNKKRWVFTSRFTSGSQKFLLTLFSTLRENGLNRGFVLEKYKKRGFELVFSHRDSLALYKLMYHTSPNTELYLPRKYELFSKAIHTLYPKCGRSSIG